jgi:hypothetical protein
MNKLVVLGLAFGILGLLAYSGVSGPAVASDAKPCARSSFDTRLVERACKAGGQDAAKKAMQKFVADVRKAKRDGGDDKYRLVCTDCHTSVKEDYPLKSDGLQQFNQLNAFLQRSKK